jgi:vacuolar-type H+-ATPase subunit I/STV1
MFAYSQPITRAQIDDIRGVRSEHAINKLVEYGLVEEAGRLSTIGRPILFKTTDTFLRHFGFRNINELPKVKEELIEVFKKEIKAQINYQEEYEEVNEEIDEYEQEYKEFDKDNEADKEEVRKSYNNMKESVKKSVDTIIAIENKETGTTTEAILTEEEYKGLCEKFEYKDIARNPKEYENKNVIVTGKVIQVSEGWFNTVRLRVATKGYTDDVYLITYKQVESNRILEEDRVTIWGKCTGVTTYTSVLGDNITVPSVEMKYYEIHQ